MRTVWDEGGERRSRDGAALAGRDRVRARRRRARQPLTPELVTTRGETELLLVDLGRGQQPARRLRARAGVRRLGDEPPDLDDPRALRALFAALRRAARGGARARVPRSLRRRALRHALLEMAFAGGCGPRRSSSTARGPDSVAGAVHRGARRRAAGRAERAARVLARVRAARARGGASRAWQSRSSEAARIDDRASTGRASTLRRVARALRRAWSETHYHACKRCATTPTAPTRSNAGARRSRRCRPGSAFDATFDLSRRARSAARRSAAAHRDPARAGRQRSGRDGGGVHRAGFDAVDVHMTRPARARRSTSPASAGLVACGGFSYGDVLGAGQGWAKSILFHPRARDAFARFFARPDTFALGVCNGCQMLSALKELIPGAGHWPRFVRNRSEQFEARLVLVEVVAERPRSSSRAWRARVCPIPVAHGEGAPSSLAALRRGPKLVVALRFVDADGRPAERYPANPNGSPGGITALTTPRRSRHDPDAASRARVPHRAALVAPRGWGEDRPWMRMFRNARAWVDR